MSKLRNVLLVVSGLVTGAVLVPPGMAAAKDAVMEVLVTNTADRPVPVTGTVAVSDDRVPFEVRVNVSQIQGSTLSSGEFVVPADRRLVVEFVSASVSLPSGQTPLLSANASTGATGFAIPLTLQGVGNGNAFFTGATPVLDFAAAGSTYRINFERQNPAGGLPSGSGSGFVYLSGYLLPA
ncbi:MAG TPA: hypothetical protein VFO65_04565 [Acidimicrobiales bacterium]|nr:hypothetical protein [Acidimicrobiales bacterium]